MMLSVRLVIPAAPAPTTARLTIKAVSPDYGDGDHPGSLPSGHAEKQLMAFDFNEHIILAEEIG